MRFVLFTGLFLLRYRIMCLFVFCLLIDLFSLSVPVQVTDWKDSSPKCVDGDVKPHSFIRSLTHSLTQTSIAPDFMVFHKMIRLFLAQSDNNSHSSTINSLRRKKANCGILNTCT